MGYSLTVEGKNAYVNYLNRIKEQPYFDELRSALELIRIFFDDLNQDGLLLLIRDYHREYFTQQIEDEEFIKNKERLSLELLRRNSITQSRYEELVGHPIE